MNESIEFFVGPPSFTDLVDRVMRKYGYRVDEMSLRGHFYCGKARAHYVLMKLSSDANWKQYEDIVYEANVACLEVIAEIVHCEFEEDGVVGVKVEESLSQSGGHEYEDDGVENEEDGPQFDIANVHDVEVICESSMVNFEGTSVGESPMIKKGMKFNSLKELKFFLADYAVRLHRSFSVVYSDKILRYNMICKQGCHWRVGIIRKDSETSVPSLVESIFAFSGYRVKYSKAWRVKEHAVALLWGDWKESYGMVPRVLTAIAYYNSEHILQRVFWCFPQCSEVFQHCRPVILVDGTFLTGKIPVKGTLMMAVGVDPEQENNESWSWFMKLVRRHVLGPSRIVCITSDRHHGFLNCAKDHMDGFSPLVHRWCTRHFAANMSHRQKNDRVIEKLKTLCKVDMEREFSEKLEDLVNDLNDDAKECLKGEMEDKDKWAQFFDKGGMRWCIMTTNYSESLNAVFKGIRSRSVCGIIEYSFKKCNAYFVYRWVGYVRNPNLMRNKVRRRQKKCFTGDMDMLQGRLCADYGTDDFDVDKMAAPAYPLLESAYDLQHRAHHLGDLNEDLKPLRARVHSPLRWDERYAEYLQRVSFLDFAVQVVVGVPSMDGSLLIVMVDRWRPEIHTFHLPFGDMSITMQDVAMILDLPLEGHPVTGIIQNENCRDMVEIHIGIRPPEPEDGDNSKKTFADVYDTVTRYGTQPERAPLHDYMRIRKSCRRMAMRMNCMSSSDVHHGGNGQGTSSGSRRTPLATPPRAATPSTAAGPSRRSRGKASPQASEDSEGEQSEDDDPTYGEELEISGMIDVPPVT
uniref:Aminotransferase-like plant mobile domain-containing protein n=1 Tax=Setaria italica TaxID=4555 RepID=K3Z0Q7_SETIT